LSLLGRLEDLPLSDILQIVFLSRRSGRLIVRTVAGEYGLLFRQGLIAGLNAPGQSESPPGPEELEDWIAARLPELLDLRQGEFDFVIADAAPPGVIGFPPQRFLAGGEKFKPLAGLEDSLRAGKNFLRASATPPPPRTEPQLPFERTERPDAAKGARFSVRRPGLSGDTGPVHRRVLLFAPGSELRVAVRRTLSSSAAEVHQYGMLNDAQARVEDFARDRAFFVSVLDCTTERSSAESLSLAQFIHRVNGRLPVAIVSGAESVDSSPVIFGADVVISNDSRGLAVLDRFVEERLWHWERVVSGYADEGAAAADFYENAMRETVDRRFALLEALILELTSPDDIVSLGSTLLRAAAEYVDRAALFEVRPEEFHSIIAFGPEGRPTEATAGFTISRDEESVLRDVSESGRGQRGKLRKTDANVRLLQSLGPELPTEAIALPIVYGEEVLGVFYGDNAAYRQPISDPSGLEIFLAQAGRAFQRALSGGTRGGW
jgi:hypothetical protein